MEPMYIVIAAVIVVIALVTLLATRARQRDAALQPVRLGPSWSPVAGDEEVESTPAVSPEEDERRATFIVERTEHSRETVDHVLRAWREYLSVLGLVPLGATYQYEHYDPYNPPVPRRAADGRPLPDRERVARDVGIDGQVPERTASEILETEAAYRAADADAGR